VNAKPFRLLFFVNSLFQIRRTSDRICAAVATPNGTRMDGGGGDLRSTIKKWNVIYPVYLNSKKTVAEGRRIAAAKACPDPTCVEIADCCSHLKIPHAVEVPALIPSPIVSFSSSGLTVSFVGLHI
jgi:signal recognition particle subunit SEC65